MKAVICSGIVALLAVGQVLCAAAPKKRKAVQRHTAVTAVRGFDYDNADVKISDGTKVKGKVIKKDAEWITVQESSGMLSNFPLEEVLSVNGVPAAKVKDYPFEQNVSSPGATQSKPVQVPK